MVPPRALGDSVRPRLQVGAPGRPLNFTVRAHMQRPRAVSALAVVLGLLGASALAGLIATPWNDPLVIAPQLLRIDPILAVRVLHILDTVYVSATLVCAYALWTMRAWAPAAYACFVASIVAYMGALLYAVAIPTPAALLLTFVGVAASMLYLGWRVVHGAFGVRAMRSNNRWRGP